MNYFTKYVTVSQMYSDFTRDEPIQDWFCVNGPDVYDVGIRGCIDYNRGDDGAVWKWLTFS